MIKEFYCWTWAITRWLFKWSLVRLNSINSITAIIVYLHCTGTWRRCQCIQIDCLFCKSVSCEYTLTKSIKMSVCVVISQERGVTLVRKCFFSSMFPSCTPEKGQHHHCILHMTSTYQRIKIRNCCSTIALHFDLKHKVKTSTTSETRCKSTVSSPPPATFSALVLWKSFWLCHNEVVSSCHC